MSGDEVSIVKSISDAVNDSETRIIFEKQSVKMKKKFINIFKNKIDSLETQTALLERNHLEISENTCRLEKTLSIARMNNEVMDNYIVCLKSQLNERENKYQTMQKKSQDDIERLQNEYDKQIELYEQTPLAVERSKLLEIKNTYSGDIAKLDAKIKIYKDNLNKCYEIQNKDLQEQTLRLAKYVQDKHLIKELKERIEMKEAKYIALLAKKENPAPKQPPTNNNTTPTCNKVDLESKLNIKYIKELEEFNITESPPLEEEQTATNLLAEKRYNTEKPNISKIYEETNIKKTRNTITSSFWQKTNDSNETTPNKSTEISIQDYDTEELSRNRLEPEIFNEESLTSQCSVPDKPQNGDIDENKKINVIEDISLNEEEATKILDKVINKDQSHEVVQVNNDTFEQNMPTDNLKQNEQTISKFFDTETPSKDEAAFAAPDVKQSKMEEEKEILTTSPYKRQTLRELEMEFKSPLSCDFSFDESRITQSDNHDNNTMDFDEKFLTTYVLSPEQKVKEQDVKTKEKKEETATPSCSNFLTSFLGSDTLQKQSSSLFNFTFGRNTETSTDKNQTPSFFDPFTNDKQQKPNKNVEKTQKSLFFN